MYEYKKYSESGTLMAVTPESVLVFMATCCLLCNIQLSWLAFIYGILAMSMIGDEEEDDPSDYYDPEYIMELLEIQGDLFMGIVMEKEFYEFYRQIVVLISDGMPATISQYLGLDLDLWNLEDFFTSIFDEPLITPYKMLFNYYRVFWIKFVDNNMVRDLYWNKAFKDIISNKFDITTAISSYSVPWSKQLERVAKTWVVNPVFKGHLGNNLFSRVLQGYRHTKVLVEWDEDFRNKSGANSVIIRFIMNSGMHGFTEYDYYLFFMEDFQIAYRFNKKMRNLKFSRESWFRYIRPKKHVIGYDLQDKYIKQVPDVCDKRDLPYFFDFFNKKIYPINYLNKGIKVFSYNEFSSYRHLFSAKLPWQK